MNTSNCLACAPTDGGTAGKVQETLAAASIDTSKLSIVDLDLTCEKGWDDAVTSCDYVMHVASPFVMANPKNEGI